MIAPMVEKDGNLNLNLNVLSMYGGDL